VRRKKKFVDKIGCVVKGKWELRIFQHVTKCRTATGSCDEKPNCEGVKKGTNY